MRFLAFIRLNWCFYGLHVNAASPKTANVIITARTDIFKWDHGSYSMNLLEDLPSIKAWQKEEAHLSACSVVLTVSSVPVNYWYISEC